VPKPKLKLMLMLVLAPALVLVPLLLPVLGSAEQRHAGVQENCLPVIS
jgi:hypothetical protein